VSPLVSSRGRALAVDTAAKMAVARMEATFIFILDDQCRSLAAVPGTG
jgi:hypothetical protein